MLAVDMSRPFPVVCRHFPELHVRGKKRKRAVEHAATGASDKTAMVVVDDQDNTADRSRICTLCLRYNSMLYMDCVADNEMVIVEQPWLDVVATFPEPLLRKVYGA